MPPKPSKLQPALLGGAIIGFISATPFLKFFNCLCCAGLLLGGFLAVMSYKNYITTEMKPLSSVDAVAVGALAGVFGAMIETILGAIILALFGSPDVELLLQALVELIESNDLEFPQELYEILQDQLQHARFGNLGLH